MIPSDVKYSNISDFLSEDFLLNYLSENSRLVFNKYYSSYLNNFSSYSKFYYNRQTKEITKFIRSGNLDVLEVGAGCGSESIWFALNGANVTAIDISSERLTCATERKNYLIKSKNLDLSINFVSASIFDHNNAIYDIVWMEQTYHHVEPREKLLDKINHLLKPAGKLVICEVNGWNPLLQIQFFLQRGFNTIIDRVDSEGNRIIYGNERITTPRSIKQLALKSGFAVKRISHFRLLPNCNPPSWWLRVEHLIIKLFPFLSTHFIIILEKK